MISSDIIEYSDLYSYAADMHKELGKVFESLDSVVLELDNKSIQSDINDSSSKHDPAKLYVPIIRSVFNNILSNFSQTTYMSSSFIELYKYQKKHFNMTFDEFLSHNSLKVFKTFADVSSEFGQNISDENIKGV
jgi:hypothetical protein